MRYTIALVIATCGCALASPLPNAKEVVAKDAMPPINALVYERAFDLQERNERPPVEGGESAGDEGGGTIGDEPWEEDPDKGGPDGKL